jgi:hypothetical protein
LAGRPIYRAMIKNIEEKGGDDWVISQIADGATIKAIAEQQLNISRSQLSIYMNAEPERKQKLQQARQLYAARLAEEVIELADGVEERNEAIGKAKLQIDARKWAASCLDPDTYGNNKPQVAVNISVNDQHLAAVRALSMPENVIEVTSEQPTDSA